MTDEQAQELVSDISALFPDNAPHKHPETGVSLLDDVRDAIQDGHRYRFEAKDLQYEIEQKTRLLENASQQIRSLQGMNESLLKALAAPMMSSPPPIYVMNPDDGNIRLPSNARCIFCDFRGSLEELKHHSARCPEHPAVKALAEVYKR